MNQTTVGVIGAGRIGRMHTENLVHHIPRSRGQSGREPSPRRGLGRRARDPHPIDRQLGGLRRSRDRGGRHHRPVRPPQRADPTGRSGGQAHLLRKARRIRARTDRGGNRSCKSRRRSAPGRFQPALRPEPPSIWPRRSATGEVGELHSLRVTNRDPSGATDRLRPAFGRHVLRLSRSTTSTPFGF